MTVIIYEALKLSAFVLACSLAGMLVAYFVMSTFMYFYTRYRINKHLHNKGTAMKIRVYCNLGRETVSALVDTYYFGLTGEEWQELSEDNKMAIVEEWAWQSGLEVGYEELV